ncbi:MAG: DUF58 domain-containing protein [Phycisphaerales bacterium JB063]
MPTTASFTSYLDPQTLARVGSLEMRARMIVEGLMSGQHRSPMQGFSVEFAQHRQYVAGDDLRFLDWKVMAKTDKLYLKQYVRETNLDLMVLVDVSASMGYTSGTRFTGGKSRGELMNEGKPPAGAGRDYKGQVPAGWRKIDHAAALAVAVSHLALMQQDRVGLAVFADDVRQSTRLSNNGHHWRNITQALVEADLVGPEPGSAAPKAKPTAESIQGRTHLAPMFDRMIAGLQRKSLVVLISDLFDDPAVIEQGLAKLRHRGHDAIVLGVMDPAELTFPFRSVSEFMGMEGEGRLPLDAQSIQKAYLEVVAAHRAAVESACQKFRFDHLLLNTSEPLGAPLSMFLARRAAMIARGS